MFFQFPFLLFSQDIEYSKQNISNTMTDTAAHREMCWTGNLLSNWMYLHEVCL